MVGIAGMPVMPMLTMLAAILAAMFPIAAMPAIPAPDASLLACRVSITRAYASRSRLSSASVHGL